MTSGYLVLTLKPDECILLSDDVGRILAEVHLPKERTTNERLAFRARSDIHISRAAVAGTRTKLRARLRGIRHAAASVTPTARKEPEVHTLIADIEKEIP